MLFSAIVAPKILYPKQRLYSLVGVNYSLLCEVVANPAAKVIWSRGYGNMPASRFASVNESLRISPFRTEDEGFYICTAENYLGIFFSENFFSLYFLICSFVICGTFICYFSCQKSSVKIEM